MTKNWGTAIAAGVMLLGPFAWAFQGDSQSIGSIRQDRGATVEPVKLEGRLSCDLGEENYGQSCTPRLTEFQSGRTYRLRGSSLGSVMRMYFDGARNVTVEGIPSGDSLKVQSIQKN